MWWYLVLFVAAFISMLVILGMGYMYMVNLVFYPFITSLH